MNEANGNVKTAGGVMPPMVLWNTEVIPVMKGEDGGYYVSARELWQNFKVRTQFSKWFARVCGYCLLAEGMDYTRMDRGDDDDGGDGGLAPEAAVRDGRAAAVADADASAANDWESGQPVDTYQSKMTDNRKAAQYRGDFLLTLEAAKEIAMIQRSREAHGIRRKLIELEHRVRQGRFREGPVGLRMAAVDPLGRGEGAVPPRGAQPWQPGMAWDGGGDGGTGTGSGSSGPGWGSGIPVNGEDGRSPAGEACVSGLPARPMAPAAFLRKAEDLMAAMDRVDARMGAIAGDAAFGRAVADAPDLLSATQIAKEYGLSAVAFNQLLAGLGVQYKKSGQWLLYAKYEGQGYTRTVYTTIVHRDNKKSVVLTTKWTPRGRKFLYGLLAGRGVEPGAVVTEKVVLETEDGAEGAGEGGGIDG